MSDSSVWGTSILTDLYRGQAQESMNKHLQLHAMFAAQLEKDRLVREAQDKAYLASLSPAQRKCVLLHRRIDEIERRYRRWWEDNVAWRFGKRPECWDD